LSLSSVGEAVGLSTATVSRIQARQAPDVGVVRISQMFSVVGLELSARAYPGGSPVRDQGHGRVLTRFRARLHRSLGWSLEVPMPGKGDQRAWDALIRGNGWLYGVEAETHPTDAQALIRRLELKARDSGVTGVILVLSETRHTRAFVAAAADLLQAAFPVPGRRALELLGAGVDPGGSALIVL
jgi:hypothetical protein